MDIERGEDDGVLVEHVDTKSEFQMRAYQQQTLNRVYEELEKGHKRILMYAPTGAGKTKMAVQMILDIRSGKVQPSRQLKNAPKVDVVGDELSTLLAQTSLEEETNAPTVNALTPSSQTQQQQQQQRENEDEDEPEEEAILSAMLKSTSLENDTKKSDRGVPSSVSSSSPPPPPPSSSSSFASASASARFLFVVNRIVLIEQTVNAFEAAGLSDQVGIIHAKKPQEKHKPIQVASIQTLLKREWPSADYIFIDEAHCSVSESYLRLCQQYSNRFVIGLTATPCRSKQTETLKTIYEVLVYGPQPHWLIENNFLVPPLVYGISAKDQETLCKKRNGVVLDVKTYPAHPDMIRYAIRIWKKRCSGRRTICFCSDVEHAKAVQKAFQENEISAEQLDGETPTAVRESIYSRFKSGEVLVITCVNVLSEGFDEPRVESILMLRHTRSRALYIQQVGRGLRLAPDINKKNCIILDLVGNSLRHGLVTDPQIYKLEDAKEHQRGDAPVKSCRVCAFLVPLATKICTECQTAFESSTVGTSLTADLEPLAEKEKEEKKKQKIFAFRCQELGLPVFNGSEAISSRESEFMHDMRTLIIAGRSLSQPQIDWLKRILGIISDPATGRQKALISTLGGESVPDLTIREATRYISNLEQGKSDFKLIRPNSSSPNQILSPDTEFKIVEDSSQKQANPRESTRIGPGKHIQGLSMKSANVVLAPSSLSSQAALQLVQPDPISRVTPSIDSKTNIQSSTNGRREPLSSSSTNRQVDSAVSKGSTKSPTVSNAPAKPLVRMPPPPSELNQQVNRIPNYFRPVKPNVSVESKVSSSQVIPEPAPMRKAESVHALESLFNSQPSSRGSHSVTDSSVSIAKTNTAGGSSVRVSALLEKANQHESIRSNKAALDIYRSILSIDPTNELAQSKVRSLGNMFDILGR